MRRAILAGITAYLIGAAVLSLIGAMLGSFVLMEWWSPLSSIVGRGFIAWLALAPGLIAFLYGGTHDDA